jgi:hypothetical protein
MLNETIGVNNQNRRQKNSVWQNSEFVNVQWCGKCAYLIIISGRLNNNAATNGGKTVTLSTATWYECWLKCTSCRHDSYRIISDGTLACSNNSTVVLCSYSCLCHTVFHILCLCL